MASVEAKQGQGCLSSFQKASSSLRNLRRKPARNKTISEETRMVDLAILPLEKISIVPNFSSKEIDYSKAPTQRQIHLLQETWNLIKKSSFDGDAKFLSPVLCFGQAFYQCMFTLQPSTVQLFHNNFVRQANALAGMLQYIVIKLENAYDPEFAADVKSLGARHVHYGVKLDNLAVLAPAVDYALRDRLRGKYTQEIGQAWRCANSFLAHIFKQGMMEEMQRLGYTDIESPTKQPS